MWRYRFSFPEALKHLGIHRTAIRPRRNDPPKSVLRLLAEAVVYGPLADPARVERIRWRNELETSMGLYRQTNRRLAELARGAAEAYEGEREDCWALLPLLLQDIRLSEKLYAEACED